MSSLPLSFTLTPHKLNLLSTSILSNSKQFFYTPSPKSFTCYTLSSSSDSSYDKEETHWLREEQRWLREEQRWLREEKRWKAERDTLLHEIHKLQLTIQELQCQSSVQKDSVSGSLSNIAKLLQVLKDGDLGININQITDTGSSAIPLVNTEIKEKKVIVKEVRSVSDASEEERKIITPRKESQIKGSKRKTLRKGSEGDDVREIQEALQKLGFYSGEDDMEYSAFDSGTESAVKTWQSSIGMSEDGIMTSELLDRLYMDETGDSSFLGDENSESDVVASSYQTANGVPISTATEIQQTIEKGVDLGGDLSEHRVFLLGENRWEDPSRLSGKKKESSSMSDRNSSATMCLTCRGEGRLLCMECDGTGEPNIEEQFMEWVDEGTKCPYCEGHGYNVCDICQGKKLQSMQAYCKNDDHSIKYSTKVVNESSSLVKSTIEVVAQLPRR